ncbi:radical SAM protein [Peptococcus simiae]|uniref:radical SAM protein n=1 Tax=Peptococcus simiae TaxID=1643805 RepID=UPI00397FB8E0
MFQYDRPLYRPPSEARSLIFQVTLGCSHNTCTFCSMYRSKAFRVRPWAAVEADLREGAEAYPDIRRIFLADGDAMVLSYDWLVRILTTIRTLWPHGPRVSVYARSEGVLSKSDEELAHLRDLGLALLYIGLESGDDQVLEGIEKGETVADIIRACDRAQAAGMAVSVMAIVGLAGKAGSDRHALETAKALNRIRAQYIGLLTLMVEPDTPLADQVRAGAFQPLSPEEAVAEMRTLMGALDSPGSYFSSTHPSNYFVLSGRLNEAKADLLEELDFLLAHPDRLYGTHYRRL